MTISPQMLRSMGDELQKLSGVTDRLRDVVRGAVRSGGHEMGEGFKESLGEGAAALGRKATQPKVLAALGAGGATAGGVAAYGLHRARKNRQKDMTQAVREALAERDRGQS